MGFHIYQCHAAHMDLATQSTATAAFHLRGKYVTNLARESKITCRHNVLLVDFKI